MAQVPGSTVAQTQVQPTMTVNYTVNLSQHFTVLAGITQHISLSIHLSTTPRNSPGVILVTFAFNYLGFSAPAGINKSVSVISQHPLATQVKATVPPGMDNFTVTILGDTPDFSLLYRDTATLPYASVVSNLAPYNPTSYTLVVPTLPGVQFVSVVPFTPYPLAPGVNQSVPSEITQVGGKNYLTTGFPSIFSKVVILYQPELRDFSVILFAAALILLVVATPFAYRRVRPRIPALTMQASRFVFNALNWFTGRRLLGIFVASLALMAGLALIFGPAPTPRLYLAATPPVVANLGPSLQKAGYQYFTPLDAGDEFDTMASLGNFNAVVIVDYPPPINSLGLYASNRIYLVGDQLPAAYVYNVTSLFGHKVVVQEPNSQALLNDLTGARLYVVTNRLGLPITTQVYNGILVVEGVLTLVATFAGMAFLSRTFVESGAKGWLFLAEAAAMPVLVYMFTTMVFTQSSVLLGLPVALHAAISSGESAIGSLGFGGGSRPRELLGVLGFLFGGVSGYKGRMKLDRVGLIAIVGLLAFLVTDPLSLGLDFYGLLQNLMTSESGGIPGLAAQETVRGALGTVMDFFGRFISPFYYSSHGAVMFYVGAVPFAIFSRLKNTTATVLLFFCSFAASLGFIRVADLNPAESLASPSPGILLGLGVMIAFLLLSMGESRIRKLFS
jgi:hypothetical protein